MYIIQRLAVAIQRGNAISISGTLSDRTAMLLNLFLYFIFSFSLFFCVAKQKTKKSTLSVVSVHISTLSTYKYT